MRSFIFHLESNSSTESISLLSSSGCCNTVWGFQECGPDISPAFYDNTLNISFLMCPPQPESLLHHHVDLFLIFHSKINSQTQFLQHTSEDGAWCSSRWAVAARFILPTQSHKVNKEPFRKFQLPPLHQNKNSSCKVFGQLKLPQISVGKSHHFPHGNFSAFSELLLRTKLRFKSDHGCFTWPKFSVMNLNSRDLHEACSL